MDSLCYLCFVFVMLSCLLMQPCGYLLGKGWPLGSLVYGVLFLSLSNVMSWSGVVLDCIDS